MLILLIVTLKSRCCEGFLLCPLTIPLKYMCHMFMPDPLYICAFYDFSTLCFNCHICA